MRPAVRGGLGCFVRLCVLFQLAGLSLTAANLTIQAGSVPATGVVGAAYSGSVTAKGGNPPYSFSISSGSLPNGLSLSKSGSITGTPAAAGSFNFTIRVTDDEGDSDSRSFSIVVSPRLTITTTSPLQSGTVGSSYSRTLAASGGTPPYRWSGSAPAGLSLSTSGSIAGTPNAAGSFSFTATVTDNNSATANRSFALTINAPPLTITTTSPLARGRAGVAYSQTLAASGGVPPYRWSGTVPAGLSLAAAGSISGTPSTPGTFSFTATVTDSMSVTANRNFSIAIDPPALAITTGPILPAGTVGTAYSQNLSASGGTPPYRWSGLALAGLTLGSDGLIAGTPSTAGTFTFAAQVSDAASLQTTGQFTITIDSVSSPLAITTSGILSSIAVRAQYSQTLNASGGTPPYAWSTIAGALPAGIVLNPNGTLGGAADAAGVFSFTARVTDSAALNFSKQFTLNVTSGLTITTAPSLPPSSVGSDYSQPLSAAGGVAPYTWSIVAGALPAGLSIDASTGTISGVLTAAGVFTFTTQVIDRGAGVATKQFTLLTAAGLTIVTPPILSGGAINMPYSQPLVATGGIPLLTWSISSGQLPPGLSLDPSSGAISGIASEAGSFSFTVQVSDSASLKVSKQLTITIAPGLTISTAPALPAGAEGAAYGLTLVAAGGRSPYIWSIISGSLPPGLDLDPSNGRISGTLSAAGTFGFTAQVSDSGSVGASKQFTITIAPHLAITTSPLVSNLMAGTVFTLALAANGGTPPYVWAVTAGSLPDGLALDAASGLVSGRPSAPGPFELSIQVSDNAGAVSSRQFSLSVDAPPMPAISLNSIPDTADPAQQLTLDMNLAGTYPLAIAGTATLRFVPDASLGGDDPAIQFSTGGRSASFIIPANSTGPAPQLAFQTGTVAGTIELSIKLQGLPDLNRTIKVTRSVPAIRSMRVLRNSAGFELRVIGFSTSRDLAQATVRFTGAGLLTSELVVPLAELSSKWYQSAASAPFGSQFTLVLPFTVQGDPNAIQSVTLIITNAQGASAPGSSSF